MGKGKDSDSDQNYAAFLSKGKCILTISISRKPRPHLGYGIEEGVNIILSCDRNLLHLFPPRKINAMRILLQQSST